MARRRQQGAGTVRQLPSGRWQVRYRDESGERHGAPTTFITKQDAVAWLASADRTAAVSAASDPALADYAASWLAGRGVKPRTREGYLRLLETLILPALGTTPLSKITVARVRTWYATLDPAKATTRSHAYLLLHAIMATAYADDHIGANPCRIRGAGAVKVAHKTRPATLPELAAITAAMPERYRLMVVLAAWCGLRYGELTELRRGDVHGTSLAVTRAVVRVGGSYLVGQPKSDAGRRTVAVPPHLAGVLAEHLAEHVESGEDALLFPARHGGHMAPSSLCKVWYPAREAAGRPDLRFHDLRHTGATLAAATGATLADLMARLGHSTTSAAMRYQHSVQDRDTAIALALSGFAEAGQVSLTAR